MCATVDLTASPGARTDVPVRHVPARARRHASISVTHTVPVAPESLYDFIADLDNHERFAHHRLHVARLDGEPGARHGGEVHIRGPLWVRRVAQTRVLTRHAPYLVAGRAQIGRRTVAQVRWTLHPNGDGTHVELTADVHSAGPLDRLLLAIGGRPWLRRHMAASLLALAAVMAAP